MAETATTWNEIERWEIKGQPLIRQARDCTVESTCAGCGGPIIPGESEVIVKRRPHHWSCAEDLGVEVR